MNHLQRWIVGGLGSAGMVLVTVLALPGVANAAALPTETVTYGSTTAAPPPATSNWDFATTTHFWSVAGVYSDNDYDLDLSAGGSYLASSTFGSHVTDFVAIDSNDGRWPLGDYSATVRRYSGTANFAVERMQGRFTITLPIPADDGVSGPADPDIAITGIGSNRVVRISDIYLHADESFWSNSHTLYSDLFFLESDPANPSTWVRTRSDVVNSGNATLVDGCTLFTAKYTGWHAIVMVNNSFPESTNPPGGTGFALHRYSPSRPNSCPIKNFPNATP